MLASSYEYPGRYTRWDIVDSSTPAAVHTAVNREAEERSVPSVRAPVTLYAPVTRTAPVRARGHSMLRVDPFPGREIRQVVHIRRRAQVQAVNGLTRILPATGSGLHRPLEDASRQPQ